MSNHTVAQAALAAGYIGAKDLGESITVLDRLCGEHGITPMTIGEFKFYPSEEIRRRLAESRTVPDGMVPLTDWVTAVGVNYHTLRSRVIGGAYTGRHGKYRPRGSTKKAQHYVYPDEAAEFCGIHASADPTDPTDSTGKIWRGLSAAAKLSSIPKAELRELVERDEIEGRQHDGKLQIEEHSLRAYMDAPAGAAPNQAPRGAEPAIGHATMREAIAEIERRVVVRLDEGIASILKQVEKTVDREMMALDAHLLREGGSVDSLIRLSRKMELLADQFERVRAIVAGRASGATNASDAESSS